MNAAEGTSRLPTLVSRHPIVICPLVTPLTSDQRLDQGALRRHVEQVDPQVDGLMLLGTTGELAVLPAGIAEEVIETVTALRPSSACVVGVGGAGMAATLSNLRGLGPEVDSAAVCAPYYYTYLEPELEHYFLTIADASPVPVILYNIPQHTGNALSARLITRLSTHENIIGIKDSRPSPSKFAEVLETASDSFFVLRGTDELHTTDYLESGVQGFVSGLENIIPGVMRTLITAWRERRFDDVERECTTLRHLARVVTDLGGIRAIKFAVSLRVGSGSTPALPGSPLTENEAARLLAAVALADQSHAVIAT